mmetsp:Transcript_9707/g.14577  ORF Transcript_9707/g.14577 Transcript_9707/m.14577 type:complete len:82 (+) Transcript_9707:1039-1284(+)
MARYSSRFGSTMEEETWSKELVVHCHCEVYIANSLLSSSCLHLWLGIENCSRTKQSSSKNKGVYCAVYRKFINQGCSELRL